MQYSYQYSPSLQKIGLNFRFLFEPRPTVALWWRTRSNLAQVSKMMWRSQ
jgi:hypothetical protein